MCSKPEGIFKQICLTTWTHACIRMHGVTWHFNSKKLKKNQKHMKPLLDVMSCHQDDVKKIGMFDDSLDTRPSQIGSTH